MIGRWLGRRGFHVVSRPDARRVVEDVEELRPLVVLMDLDLPTVDGFEATRRLKACESTADIPVVALTAHAMRTDREQALTAGCDGFETKPIDIDRLCDTLRSLARPRPPIASGPAID